MVLDKSLTDLAQELKEACERRDSERLTLLDEQIKKLVAHHVAESEGETESAQLVAYLKRLQAVYQLVISDSVKHRDEIASELSKLTKDKKAASSYLNSSKLR